MADIYVDASKADDSGDGLSLANAKKTLQAGLDAAGGHADSSSTVNVVDGTYAAVDLSSTHDGKAITVKPYAAGAVTITSAVDRCIDLLSTQASGSWTFEDLTVSAETAYSLFRNQCANAITVLFDGCTLSATVNANARIFSNEAALASPAYVQFKDCTMTSKSYPFRFTARCGFNVSGGTLDTESTIALISCAGANSSPLWVEITGGADLTCAGNLLSLDYTTPCVDVIDHVLILNSTLDLGKVLINSTSLSTPWMSQYIDRWLVLDSELTTADNFGVFGPSPEGANTDCTLSTRTNDTQGVITKSGHKICTNTTMDFTWTGGARYNVVVDSRDATTVTFSGGTGDNLPAETTTGLTMKQRTVSDHPFVEMVWRGNTLTCTKTNPTHTICFMVGCNGMIWDDNELICTSETFATGYGGFVCKSDYAAITNSVFVSGNVVVTCKATSYLRFENNVVYSKSGTGFDLTVSQDVGDDSDYPTLGYPVMPSVRNNIFYSVDGLAAQFGAAGTTLNAQHPLVDYNCYYSGGTNIIALAGSNVAASGGVAAIQEAWATNMTDAGPSQLNDAHSVLADPKFTDADTNDFSLLGTSTVRQAGYPSGKYMGGVPLGLTSFVLTGRSPFFRLSRARVLT